MSATASAPAARTPWSLDRVLLWTCVGIPMAGLALFFLFPLATVAWRSLVQKDGGIGLGNYAEVFATRGILTATANSLTMSAATTAVSLLLGFAIAYGLDRSRMRGKAYVKLALVLPLLAPSLVQGLGLIFILGRNGLVHRWTGWEFDIYGFWGLLISNVFYALPQAVLILQAALRNTDARYYDAAEVMGASSTRQFFDITLPNCKFGLLSAAFVVFVITITDFGNAAVIGGNYKVLATEIYSQVSGQMNFGMGSVVGILLLLPSLISVQIERVASQRQFGSASPSGLRVMPQPARGRDRAFTAGVLLCTSAIVATVATVVFASFMRLWPYRMEWTLKHYDITVSGGYAPLWTSLYLSLAAASGGVLLLFFLTFGVCRILGQAGVPGVGAAGGRAWAGAGPVVHLRLQFARHAAVCAVRQRRVDRPVQFLPLSHAGLSDDDDGDARSAASAGGSGQLPGRGHLAGAARCRAAADRPHRIGRVLLPVHAVHGHAVRGDIPGDALGQRGAGFRLAAGRSGLRLAGGGLFDAYHAGRGRFPAGDARVDRAGGAAPQID